MSENLLPSNAGGHYEPFDQEAWLGKPPWKPTDAALIAWEVAHGHDVRLTCCAEYDCLVIESARERKLDAARAALNRVRALAIAWEQRAERLGAAGDQAADGLRAALDGPGE